MTKKDLIAYLINLDQMPDQYMKTCIYMIALRELNGKYVYPANRTKQQLVELRREIDRLLLE